MKAGEGRNCPLIGRGIGVGSETPFRTREGNHVWFIFDS